MPHPKQKNGIVATDSGKLLLYEDSKVTRQAKLKVARVNSLAVSPDGKWIAVVAPDTFLLFDAKDFSLRAERKMAECVSACFSRDSKLVSIATQKKGEVWETAQLIGTGSATK